MSFEILIYNFIFNEDTKIFLTTIRFKFTKAFHSILNLTTKEAKGYFKVFIKKTKFSKE
jgi:hypothetical protein